MTEEYERYKASMAAQWLEHVAQLGTRCAALNDAVEHNRAIAEGVQAVRYDGMPHAASDGQALPNAVIKLEGAIESYLTELSAYMDEQTDAHERLSRIPDASCASCLERHYLLGHAWERVCVDMGYAWQGMMSMRKRALSMAYDVMPVEWRDPMHAAI